MTEEQNALKDAASLLFTLGMAEKVEVTLGVEKRQLNEDDQTTLKLAGALLRRIAGIDPGVVVRGRG